MSNHERGFSVITLLIIIVAFFIVTNIIYSLFEVFHYPYGRYYHHTYYGRSYPYYRKGTYKDHYSNSRYAPPSRSSKTSSFEKRFHSKKTSSSFASRFHSKYGRSRVSGFRSSGFFGGK